MKCICIHHTQKTAPPFICNLMRRDRKFLISIPIIKIWITSRDQLAADTFESTCMPIPAV